MLGQLYIGPRFQVAKPAFAMATTRPSAIFSGLPPSLKRKGPSIF